MSARTTNENLPVRIGRYDVVFPLATGVSSSLVVAHLDEPASSPRPVTIKRISPDVTRGKNVEAFLASARAALAVRHPNVVEIREANAEDGELFVVMEYLEGETAAALLHRLDIDGRTLGFEVAAYIAAETAAALDAGHELGVLHERLTPHEVFIGYDGSVKVLDIGVARALDHLTMDATTVSERDLPYASPERCKGERLDRRSDVFSLGAIFWELLTGTSPFERMSPAATLRAILSEEPKAPPNHAPRSFPKELSEIALRALAREPGQRYATAAAVRDDLWRVVRSAPMGGVEPRTPLSTLMQNHFAKRIKNNARLLRRFESRRIARAPVAVEADVPPSSKRASDLERPTLDAFRPEPPCQPPRVDERPRVEPSHPSTAIPTPRVLEPSLEPMPTEQTVTKLDDALPRQEVPFTRERAIGRVPYEDEERASTASTGDVSMLFEHPNEAHEEPAGLPLTVLTRGRVRLALAATFVGLVVSGVVGLGLLTRGGSDSAVAVSPSGAPSVRPSSASLSPLATAAAATASVPATALATAAATAPYPSTAAARAETTLRIETLPTKASIVMGGRVVGASPMDLKLPKSQTPVVVEIRHPGYQTWRESIVPDVDQRLRLNLVNAPRAVPSTSTPYHRFE